MSIQTDDKLRLAVLGGYQVYFSFGGGLQRGPWFRLITDAVRYVTRNQGGGSFAIRLPRGGWYRFEGGRAVYDTSPRLPAQHQVGGAR